MAKQCQSCGMPLQTKKAGDCRGTEADGSKSEKWCSLCYENGAFIGGDCTLEEMRAIVDKALVENGSAQQVMGDNQLREIAKLLVEQVRRDATIDWQFRNSVQAKLRINVKKTLAKYGYPPDQQAIATDLVLEQAKRYGNEWSNNSPSKTYFQSDTGASIIS